MSITTQENRQNPLTNAGNSGIVEEAKALVERVIKKYSKMGVFERNRKGEWLNKEIVETDEIIGYVVDKNGELVPTKIAKIHYSKKASISFQR